MAFWNNRAGKLNLCPECCTRSEGKQHGISCARGSRKWLVDGDTGACTVRTIQILPSQEADLRQLWLTDFRKAKQCQTHRGLRKSQFLAKSSKHAAFVLTFAWEQISLCSLGKGSMKTCSLWCVSELFQKDKMNSTTKRLNQCVSLWLVEIVGGALLSWEVSYFHSIMVPGKWLPFSQALRLIHLFMANYYLTKCIHQWQTSGQPVPDPSSQKVITLRLLQGRHGPHYMLNLFFFFFFLSFFFAWTKMLEDMTSLATYVKSTSTNMPLMPFAWFKR